MPKERKVDLRVQKTERALMDAMITLLKDRPFDAITVCDLCDTAMIRRATFYKHFHDKYDFLDFCIQQRQQQFDEVYRLQGICDEDKLQYHMAVVRDMLHYLQENRALLERAKSGEMNSVSQVFTNQLMRMAEEKATAAEAAGAKLVAPPRIVAAFVSGALLGVAKWWFTTDAEMPEDDLVEHIKNLLVACMPLLANKKEEPHERQPAQE